MPQQHAMRASANAWPGSPVWASDSGTYRSLQTCSPNLTRSMRTCATTKTGTRPVRWHDSLDARCNLHDTLRSTQFSPSRLFYTPIPEPAKSPVWDKRLTQSPQPLQNHIAHMELSFKPISRRLGEHRRPDQITPTQSISPCICHWGVSTKNSQHPTYTRWCQSYNAKHSWKETKHLEHNSNLSKGNYQSCVEIGNLKQLN